MIRYSDIGEFVDDWGNNRSDVVWRWPYGVNNDHIHQKYGGEKVRVEHVDDRTQTHYERYYPNIGKRRRIDAQMERDELTKKIINIFVALLVLGVLALIGLGIYKAKIKAHKIGG